MGAGAVGRESYVVKRGEAGADGEGELSLHPQVEHCVHSEGGVALHPEGGAHAASSADGWTRYLRTIASQK